MHFDALATVLTLANAAVIFTAGALVQKVHEHDRRIERIENKVFPVNGGAK